jgi:hypothetical protein
MKGKLLTLGFMLLAVPLLAGCGLVSITGSGNVVTQEEAITGFDKVDISQGFTVDIIQGDAFSVVIRIDDNLVQYLEVVKQGSTLKIGLKPGRSWRSGTLKAEVTMPELTGLDLSGGSHATVSGSGGDVTIDASGGSGANLSAFAVVNANVKASGGSQVTVNVKGRLVADASGGSKVYYLGNPTSVTSNESGGSEVRSK